MARELRRGLEEEGFKIRPMSEVITL
jgi:hypothetical protein